MFVYFQELIRTKEYSLCRHSGHVQRRWLHLHVQEKPGTHHTLAGRIREKEMGGSECKRIVYWVYPVQCQCQLVWLCYHTGGIHGHWKYHHKSRSQGENDKPLTIYYHHLCYITNVINYICVLSSCTSHDAFVLLRLVHVCLVYVCMIQSCIALFIL